MTTSTGGSDKRTIYVCSPIAISSRVVLWLCLMTSAPPTDPNFRISLDWNPTPNSTEGGEGVF